MHSATEVGNVLCSHTENINTFCDIARNLKEYMWANVRFQEGHWEKTQVDGGLQKQLMYLNKVKPLSRLQEC